MVKCIKLLSAPLPGITLHLWGNPFQFRHSVERETMASGSHDNRNGPHRDPRDVYILIGTIAGVIICCTIGAIIGGINAGLGGIFIGVVIGMLVGGFAGSYLGEMLKNRKLKKYKKASEEKTEQNHGPFIK